MRTTHENQYYKLFKWYIKFYSNFEPQIFHILLKHTLNNVLCFHTFDKPIRLKTSFMMTTHEKQCWKFFNLYINFIQILIKCFIFCSNIH
jgi:hypothetical protein